MNNLYDNLPGRAESFWIATTEETNYKVLSKNIEVDVAILGGGITGITAGLLLKEKGKKVVIIEARKIIKGVTGHTTAKVTSLHDVIYKYLIDNFGKEGALMYGSGQEKAIELIASLVKEKNIDCDFVRASAFTYTQKEEYLKNIEEEVGAAKNLDLPASFVKETDLPFPILGAVSFSNQAHFHPRKYLLALAKLIQGQGSFIFEETRALDVKENGNIYQVITDKGVIKAKDVIVATHYPVINKGRPYVSKLTPKRSYVLEVKIKGEIPKGMFISLEQPFFSVRPQRSKKGEVLIITGDEHKTGQDDNTIGCYLELEKMVRERFEVESIDYRWSTQDNYTIDRVPYIGRYTKNSKHLFVATGFGGWGMTNGTLAAMILSDMLLEKENPFSDFFDLEGRDNLKSAKNFLITNIDNAKQFVKGRFKKYEKFNKHK